MENTIKVFGNINIPQEKQPECFARLIGLVSAGGMMTCDIEGPLVLLKPPEPDEEDFSVFFNYNYFDTQGFYEPAGFCVSRGQLMSGAVGSNAFMKVVGAMCQMMALFSSTPCQVLLDDKPLDIEDALNHLLEKYEFSFPCNYLGVAPDDYLLFWNEHTFSPDMASKLDALSDEFQEILLSPLIPLQQFPARLSQSLVRAQKEGAYFFAATYSEFLEKRELPEWQAALVLLERLLNRRTAHVFNFSIKQYLAVLANPELRSHVLEF